MSLTLLRRRDKARIDRAIKAGPATATATGVLKDGGVEGLSFEAFRMSNVHPRLDAMETTAGEIQAEIEELGDFIKQLQGNGAAAGTSSVVCVRRLLA